MSTVEQTRPAVSLLHRDPPLTPIRFFQTRRTVFLVVVGVLAVLTTLAAIDGGRILLHVDEPVTRWVAEHRTPWLTDLFNGISHFGDNAVVFPLALLLAAWTWPRCRYLAVALVLAALMRPGLEYLLKGAVDRPRPNIDPLGTFHGPSHPSGHPLAAASLWGLVPAVVALHVHSRTLWWTAVGLASAIVTGVALARVYKGAHYLTDVTASLAWAGLYLALVQGFFDRFHGSKDCRHPQHEVQTEEPVPAAFGVELP